MACKVQIPPAVMRELDTKREDLVSAAPEAKAQAGRQAGKSEYLQRTHYVPGPGLQVTQQMRCQPLWRL